MNGFKLCDRIVLKGIQYLLLLVLNLSKMILIFSNMPCHGHIGESFIQLPFGILIKLDAQVHVPLWNREQLMFAFFCISGY